MENSRHDARSETDLPEEPGDSSDRQRRLDDDQTAEDRDQTLSDRDTALRARAAGDR